MMNSQPANTSPDGSSNGNPPERCPRPLYSRDSTQEDHKIQRCYQYKRLKHITTEVKNEAKETSPKSEKSYKEEEIPIEISTDGSSNGNPPERCPRPLYSRDSTQEDHKIPRCYQYKRMKHITTEVKNEAKETSPKSEKSCKEEEIPIEISTAPGNTRATQRNVKAENEERRVKSKMKILEIGMDGRYRWYNTQKYPDSEDITAYVAKEKAMTPTPQPVRHKEEKPYSCPECVKRFTHEKYLIIHYRRHSGEKPFFCTECGKSFPYRSSLDKHKISHTAVGAFPCPECGKRFRAGWILAAHQKVHSSENLHR